MGDNNSSVYKTIILDEAHNSISVKIPWPCDSYEYLLWIYKSLYNFFCSFIFEPFLIYIEESFLDPPQILSNLVSDLERT